jgi:hypothetical protein
LKGRTHRIFCKHHDSCYKLDLSPVSIPCDWDVGGRPSLNSGYLANMP